VKRKIREVFRHIKDRVEPTMDIVIISGRDLISLPVSVLEKKFFNPFLSKGKPLKILNPLAYNTNY
jgi:ribonuclease P protein component